MVADREGREYQGGVTRVPGAMRRVALAKRCFAPGTVTNTGVW
jgi:hypothetical protein